MATDTAAAARRLGMREREVAEVTDTPDGPVVTTTTGHRVLLADRVYWYGYPPGQEPNTGLPPWTSPHHDAPEPADGDVPDGTAVQIMTWVGYDKARAARAHAAELGRDNPRSTLLAALERAAQ